MGLTIAAIFFLNGGVPVAAPLCLVLVGLSFALIVRGGEAAGPWGLGERTLIAAATLIAAILAFGAVATWPNSADEYGYLYVTDTILRGRVTNPVPPAPHIFDFYWIATHDGRTASQYPPGWPVFLIPFRLAHAVQFANPLLVAVLGGLLARALRQLQVRADLRVPLLAMVLLSPFTLFNGASLFNHLLSAVLTAAICTLQLRDDSTPRPWIKVAIGAMFAALLATRHDSFLILAVAFLIDRLQYRRVAVVRDIVWFSVGGVPILAAWLLYNRAITGQAFMPTMWWAFPQEQGLGLGGARFFIRNSGLLLYMLLAFTGILPNLMYVKALVTKIGLGRLRFYNILLPAAMLFTVFYPHGAGNQYGPRYWYFAWPTILLTIGPSLSSPGGVAGRIGQPGWLRCLISRQLYVFLGFTIGFALFLRLTFDERQAVYAPGVPVRPAVVLIPDRMFKLGPWQIRPLHIDPRDLTRNGVDDDAPVLYARDDGERFDAIACGLDGRHVFRFRPPASLDAVDCADLPTPKP